MGFLITKYFKYLIRNELNRKDVPFFKHLNKDKSVFVGYETFLSLSQIDFTDR